MYEDLEKHYNKNYKLLYNMALNRVPENSPHLAEEAVQETYCKVLAFRNDGGIFIDSPDGLIFRILFNVIFDITETEQCRGLGGRRSAKKVVEYDQSNLENISRDDDLFKQMACRIAVGEFDNQPERIREVLKLYFINGYTHKEIGSMLNITSKTSRNMVYEHLRGIVK